MPRTLAAACVAGALLSGGAGVANATVATQPLPAATTNYVAQPDNGSNNNDKSDKTGLWGLVGLLGLGGLAGLRRRKDTYPEAGLGRGTAPRA